MRRRYIAIVAAMLVTLLAAIGDYRIDQNVTPDDVTAALDILRDLLGI